VGEEHRGSPPAVANGKYESEDNMEPEKLLPVEKETEVMVNILKKGPERSNDDEKLAFLLFCNLALPSINKIFGRMRYKKDVFLRFNSSDLAYAAALVRYYSNPDTPVDNPTEGKRENKPRKLVTGKDKRNMIQAYVNTKKDLLKWKKDDTNEYNEVMNAWGTLLNDDYAIRRNEENVEPSNKESAEKATFASFDLDNILMVEV